jgi:NAD+ kinase
MKTVLLVVNENRSRAVELAQEASAWLRGRGLTVRLAAKGADGGDAAGGAAGAEAVDLAVALGGDGTMLRAVHLAGPFGAPVLGVNLGRLAYLAAIEPDDLCTALERWVAGDFTVEERAMLCFTVEGEPGVTLLALNEAVLEHSGPGHTVHLQVTSDGHVFHSYVADALILATPTGSTAYSFSAGGPVVSPRHRALLLTPVAAHTPFNRTLVLDPDEQVRVEVLDFRGAVLSVDGQDLGRLAQGDRVRASVAPDPARFVVFGERHFYQVLKAKFGLADR